MLVHLKHQFIKVIEKIPLLQIFIYNNLRYFDFLLPHDKDYYALKLIFPIDEKRSFIDVGGNIGLSSIGFRKLGYNNTIHIFEPDKDLVVRNLNNLKKKYKNLKIHSFGLSNKNSFKKLYQAYYKGIFFHFNNSFDKKYIKQKLYDNYADKSKNFLIRSKKFRLKKFDSLSITDHVCFIKIDVEGLDHLVLYGMRKCIKKNLPMILVEYNYSNFTKIYNLLKNRYACHIYDFKKNKLTKLSKFLIRKLQNGEILENLFKKNSVNIFFIKR